METGEKRKMKIYKTSKFEKLYKEAIEGIELPHTFKSDIGSCMLAAEILVKKLLKIGREDFKIIEGYITFPTVEWKDQHTWIEMYDGEIIDPTSSQWGHKNIVYLKQKRKIYTPQEYLELCHNYPITNANKYLGNYEYLGTCISTVDDSCIWDATEMAQLIENSKDFDVHGIYPFLSSELKRKVENHSSIIECGINNDIVWVYDSIDDIHYFYKKL